MRDTEIARIVRSTISNSDNVIERQTSSVLTDMVQRASHRARNPLLVARSTDFTADRPEYGDLLHMHNRSVAAAFGLGRYLTEDLDLVSDGKFVWQPSGQLPGRSSLL
jgi:hypothetical protein